MDRVGLQFLDRPGLAEQLRLVRRAEELGYASGWVAETRLTRDAISVLGAFAAVTRQIRLGAAVVNTWTRGPVLMALTHATLHELAPGRIRLGLGAYSDPLASNQGHVRSRPLAQMREYVEVVRRLWALDAPVTYEGELVRVNDILLDLGHGVDRSPIEMPIYLGATGERMMELAGEIADGVILNGFMSAEYTARALARAREAARAAGRDPGSLDFPQLVNVAMADEPDDAFAVAHRMVTMYAGGQPHIAKAAGLDPELAARIAAIVAGWPPRPEAVEEALPLVDASLVHRLVATGTPDHCRGRLREWVEAGASYPVVSPLTDNVAEMVEAFAPGR
jgi:5,10-methylenetetrahydromethanopterin reductase